MKNNYILVKKTFSRPSWLNRVFSRVFDYFLLLLFMILFYWLSNINGKFSRWYFLLATIGIIFLSNFYLVFFQWKYGQTLFMYLFNVKIFNNIKSSNRFFIKILKREFFLSIFYEILIFLLSIIFIFIGDKNSLNFFKAILLIDLGQKSDNNISQQIKIIAYFYSAFSLALLVVLIFIFINTIYKSRKITWVDNISCTDTLFVIKKNILEKSKISNDVNIDMPGIFDENNILVQKEEEKYDESI
ncbi:MAG: RDD family protein [Mycoplasmoidaceae bacterium]